MKYLSILLCLMVGVAFGQVNTNYRNVSDVLLRVTTNDGSTGISVAKMYRVAFSATSSDTTSAVQIWDFKTIYLGVQVKDTCNLLIYYSTSIDDSTYTAWTLQDSVKYRDIGAAYAKYVDFTSVALGAKSIKFRIDGSSKAYAEGVSTPYYRAYYILKKY